MHFITKKITLSKYLASLKKKRWKRMLKLIIIILLFFTSDIKEREITILRVPSQSKIFEIETNILTNVIDLYNRKNEQKIIIKEKMLNQFNEVFPSFDAMKTSNKAILGTISITPERLKKYDFSHSYLPARVAILGLKNKAVKSINNLRLGYVKATVQENIAQELKQSHQVKLKSYNNMDEIVRGVILEEVDIILLENVSAWADPRLQIIDQFVNNVSEGYGIVFPKDSDLKKVLDPYLKYYLKSQKFYKSIREIYGSEIADYYKKNLYLNSSS